MLPTFTKVVSFILVFNLSTYLYTLHTLYKKATLSLSLIYSKGYYKLLSACRFIVGKTFYRKLKFFKYWIQVALYLVITMDPLIFWLFKTNLTVGNQKRSYLMYCVFFLKFSGCSQPFQFCSIPWKPLPRLNIVSLISLFCQSRPLGFSFNCPPTVPLLLALPCIEEMDPVKLLLSLWRHHIMGVTDELDP